MEQKPTSYYIWEPLFRCRVPQLQTTSKEYLRHFGMPTTGNDAYDKDLANQLIDTAIPIAKMVEYFTKGIPVYIVKQADVKTIYEYIENHLLAWKRQLEQGVNIGGAPVDDLIAMDAFAKYTNTQNITSPEKLQTVYSCVKWALSIEILSFLHCLHLRQLIQIKLMRMMVIILEILWLNISKKRE